MTKSIINTKKLSYNFGTHWALKNISFSLDKGDFLFLTGPSGAGKTSLLRLLYAALPLTRGQAEITGFHLNRLPGKRVPFLRRQVSVVFQDFKILDNHTVFDNIALALEVRNTPYETIKKRVSTILRSLGLAKKAKSMCFELSGGEKQRVAIARAIVVNPKVLLADEPTGNLDLNLALHLMEVFKHFNRHGTTIIMATHSKTVIEAVPGAKQLRLDNGRIVNAGWQSTALDHKEEAPARKGGRL